MTLLTQAIVRLLLLPIFMLAFAVLVKGYTDTGDGFSAGVIAGSGVLLQYVTFGYAEVERRLPVRYAAPTALVGLVVALLVVFVPTTWGAPLLTHYPQPGHQVLHLGSLEIHTAVLFDAGIFLLVLGFIVHAMRLIAQAREWGDR